MKKLSYAIMAMSVVAFNVWAIGEMSFNKSLKLANDGSSAMFIDVGAGKLTVKGADVDEITVEAKIYSKEYNSIEDLKEAFEEKVELSLVNKNSTIVLKALSKKSWFGNSNSNIAIDLDVIIPHKLKLEVDDGSGSMVISDIKADVEIDDGSGSTILKNIGGNVFVDDGSGSLVIDFVEGDVKVDDGSGSQLISNVNGDVYVDDGSGTVKINTVSGNVTVDDGSGSVNITDMAGVFTLKNDGSGSIYVNGKKWKND